LDRSLQQLSLEKGTLDLRKMKNKQLEYHADVTVRAVGQLHTGLNEFSAELSVDLKNKASVPIESSCVIVQVFLDSLARSGQAEKAYAEVIEDPPLFLESGTPTLPGALVETGSVNGKKLSSWERVLVYGSGFQACNLLKNVSTISQFSANGVGVGMWNPEESFYWRDQLRVVSESSRRLAVVVEMVFDLQKPSQDHYHFIMIRDLLKVGATGGTSPAVSLDPK
jgi:hypothetical protein